MVLESPYISVVDPGGVRGLQIHPLLKGFLCVYLVKSAQTLKDWLLSLNCEAVYIDHAHIFAYVKRKYVGKIAKPGAVPVSAGACTFATAKSNNSSN